MNQVGPFLFEVNAYGSSSSPLTITYWGLEDQILADIKGSVEQQVALSDPPPIGENGKPKKRSGVAQNSARDGSNVVVVRVTGQMPLTVDTLVHRGEKEDDEPDVGAIEDSARLIGSSVVSRLEHFSKSFERVSIPLYPCNAYIWVL